MENMNSLERPEQQSFVQDFVKMLEAKQNEALNDPQMRANFSTHGVPKHVREGHPADFVQRDAQMKVRIAERLLAEWRGGMRGTQEDFKREKVLAKLPEIYQAQADLCARYAEVKDNPELSELAVIMEGELPCLNNLYKKYQEQFSA